MPTVEATPVTSESGLIKMEDRKRPAGHDQSDVAPPLKKQATSINGNKPHPDADMPWKDDLDVSYIVARRILHRTNLIFPRDRQRSKG
jgi:E3 ubiquitin-protein ligase BRE1